MNQSTNPIRLTSCQENALNILQREGNVFLTGAAGTGKSFLLDIYLKDKSAKDFPIVASTGVAAVIVGGRTFHSFFGLGILEGGVETAISKAIRNRRVTSRLQRACCVIIDEVSMLSGTLLKAAETIARYARENNEPWGGLRIIAVGDFAQLPPITPNQQNKDWAFLHPVWQESNFEPALLSTVMRTQDVEFLKILNFVRKGIVNDRVHSFLCERTAQSFDENFEGTRLYPHRQRAEQHNIRRLESIQNTLYKFKTQYTGSDRYIETAKRAIPIPDILLLKKGALIMMRKNDVNGELRWVNGSLGHIIHIEEDTLSIKLFSGNQVNIVKEQFSYLNGEGNVVMEAVNFPVTLAWATTIHKAQGASLDRMIVDLSRLWEPGQAYVALSRVRSANGLMIEQWSAESIIAEPLVTALYDSLTERAKHYQPRPLFIPPKRTSSSERNRGPSAKEKRKNRMATVLKLLQEKADIVTIAEACSLSPSTILKYIEKFIERDLDVDLTYLIEDIPGVKHIRSLYEERGLERLKPIFDDLDGKVPYNDLRLVRLAMMAEGMRESAASFGDCEKEGVLYF